LILNKYITVSVLFTRPAFPETQEGFTAQRFVPFRLSSAISVIGFMHDLQNISRSYHSR